MRHFINEVFFWTCAVPSTVIFCLWIAVCVLDTLGFLFGWMFKRKPLTEAQYQRWAAKRK